MIEKKTIWIFNQYCSTPESGFHNRHFYLATELAKLGHKVYVFSASYSHIQSNPVQFEGEIKIESFEENFKFVWIKVPSYESSKNKRRIMNWMEFAWKISRIGRFIEDKPDVILYSSLSLIGFLGAERLAKQYKVPLIFEVRDIWPLTIVELGGYSKSHPFIRFLQWVEDRAYQKSTKVISNLKYSINHMVQRGLNPEKFHWIPNGFYAGAVESAQELPDSILQLIPNDKFIVGYTGSIGTANCLSNLVEAAIKFKNDERYFFIIIGKGEFKSTLEDMVTVNGLKNILILNPIPKKQIPSMLAKFDACYIGLSHDPVFKYGVSPNKLFDYFLAAKPIIYAIDSGEYTPVKDADCGVEIQPEDSSQIVKAIEKISSLSVQQREIMGENGYKFGKENHDYEVLAKRLNKILFFN